ncbi:MAG: hypothetical protein IPQ07_31525, partial [Myxococcales bacterium]|nr:hypothetical protein [Myxococcales bacterium]
MAAGETKSWQLPAMSTARDQRIVIKTVLYTAPSIHGRFDDLPQLTETTLARRPPGGPVIEGGETRDLTYELLKSGVVVAT